MSPTTGNPSNLMLTTLRGKSVTESLRTLLTTIRNHLGVDVAFISEFTDQERIFRYVDSSTGTAPIAVGGRNPLEESFCKRVVDGRLPQLMRDARTDPVASLMQVTHDLPIGAHISVPIVLDNGDIYGTLCGFSYCEDTSLNSRDLSMMQAFATIAGQQISGDVREKQQHEFMTRRITNAISNDELSTVFQPIFQLHTMELAGFEALTRFAGKPASTPDLWFSEANQVGLGVNLEAKAVRQALQALPHFPDHLYLSVNLSPTAIVSGGLAQIFKGRFQDQVVLEVTEHAAVQHYGELGTAMDQLREMGLRIAVDDAGAGYASFKHILNLRPELIKVDLSITRNIDSDPARRALTAAFLGLANEFQSSIIAEGIENAEELETLRSLGVKYGQGFYLGKPMPLAAAVELCGASTTLD